jgi:phage terminase large subunit
MSEAGKTIKLSASGAKLLGSTQTQVLWEGGVGTGKTFQLCIFLRLLCELYPGIRILLVRQTRISLNNSVLETLEEEVLGTGHPACTPLRARNSRPSYTWPESKRVVEDVDGLRTYEGRSRIDLGGMDSPERFMSTQYDVIAFVEATEGFRKAWGQLSTRTRRYHVRRFGRPWSMQIADCNPAGGRHWLNLLANEPLVLSPDVMAKMGVTADDLVGVTAMHRIRTKIRDNPKFWDDEEETWTDQGAEYMAILARLPPDEQARLIDGLWVDRSGQVYPTFDHDKHVVNGRLTRRKEGHHKWWLVPIGKAMFGTEKLLPLDFEERPVAYFVIGADWGFLPDPGVVRLYAIDDGARAFMVKEWYRTEKALQWWAELIVKLQNDYDVRAIVTDGPKERSVTLNQMLGGKLNDRGHPIAQVAKKGPGSILAGVEMVRFALEDDSSGEPRLRYFAGALQHEPDEYLLKHHAPTDGVKEFDGYVYHERREDDGPNKTLPRDKDNHGMDVDRYVMSYLFSNKHLAVPEPKKAVTPLMIDIASDLEELAAEQRQRSRRSPRR